MLDALTVYQLRALAVLLEEESVTRAASRLGVTQPALSHTLRTLRERLDDPLLVSGRGGLQRTARAEALHGRLGRLLRELDGSLRDDGAEDPRSWSQRLVLGTWDGFPLTVLPGVLARIAQEAPGLELDLRPVPPEGSAAMVEDGRLDLCVEVRAAEGPGLRQRAISEDHFVCVVRADHPAIGETLDLDTYCRLPHALISPQGEGSTVVDNALAALGRSRRIALRVRYFALAPMLVAESDLLLTAPASLCGFMADKLPLRVLAPPLELPRFRMHMVWHERNERAPAQRWLRERIAEEARPKGSPGGSTAQRPPT